MEHTDYSKLLKHVKQHAIDELKAALKAHGGSYSWETEDDCPIVAANPDDYEPEPLDVCIHSISVDCYGDFVFEATGKESGYEIDYLCIDDIFVEHIGYIIDNMDDIPAQSGSADASASSGKNPDGIYFILSTTKAVPAICATEEDKLKSVAVGYKLGNKFANVVLHDAADGEEISLCSEDKTPCGTSSFFRNTFRQAITDWDGEGNTNDIREALNPQIKLNDDQYIPSVAQLHLLLMNIVEVNKALKEAGGEPLKEDCYWSSTEYSSNFTWHVSFGSWFTNYGHKYGNFTVRPAVAYCPL